MTDVLSKALAIAEHGNVPIPLIGKRPAISDWQNLRHVTAEQIQQWHDAGLLQNVGLLCGEASGNVVVLDFDGVGGYDAFCAAFPALADTYTVATGSGNGMHVYLKVNRLPKSTGQLNVPGGHVEIKSTGRQVVIPPSIHPETGNPYTVHKRAAAMEVATIDELLDWIAEHNPKDEPPPLPAPTPNPTGANEAYALAALNSEANALASASQGGRNNALNISAMKLGQLVASGHLTRDQVFAALYAACQSNGLMAEDGPRSFEATFNSGYEAGLNQPRYIPQNHFPGAPAYLPPAVVAEEDGLFTIGRTRVIRRKSLLSDILRRVDDDDYLPDIPPIRWPLRCMHFLGGYARVIRPGKIVAFVGASGSGKTSALETVADAFIADGQDVVIWSPEWSPTELAERAVQRHGGVTQEKLYLHELYQSEVAQGIDANIRDKLPVSAGKETAESIRVMRKWEQDLLILENNLMTVEEMAQVVAGIRQHFNPPPRVLIADYAQLLKANEAETDDSTLYNMIMRFKAMCIYNQMVGILATQTLKSEARDNIKDGKFLGTTVLNVTKNSPGSKGKVRIDSDPARLRIIDRPCPNQQFSPNAHYLGSQAGRWINDDAFNLWVTINPEYGDDVDE